jgi:hypothetical protein
MKILSIWILCALFNTHLFSHENSLNESLEITIGEIQSEHVLNEDDLQDECFDKYRKWRNRAAVTAGLAPIAGLVGLTGGAALGLTWEYGGQQVVKPIVGKVLGTILDTTINSVLPFAIIFSTITYSSVKVSHFVKASRSFRLYKEIKNNNPSSSFSRLAKRIQKNRPDLSNNTIMNIVQELQSKSLFCDGSLVSRKKFLSGRKSKKLATLKDIEKFITNHY